MNLQLRNELNQCMNRLADGDRGAFEFVFDHTWPLVHRLAIKMIGVETDAEDIAQQAFIKVFSRAPEFEKGRDALSWILGIAVFECRTLKQKYRRRKENFISEESFNDFADSKLSAEDEFLQKNLESCVREIISELSLQDQETILASFGEIARPELSGTTYRKRLQRAMERLKEKWRDRYE